MGSKRVLGSVRTLADVVSTVSADGEATAASEEQLRALIQRIAATGADVKSLSLQELEISLHYFSNQNSNFTDVVEDSFHTLAEEVLNNSIRSVMVYDDFSNYFGDAEVLSLSMAMQYNLSVEAVTMSGINISDESISTLCESLTRSRVNYLDLSNTPLEDEAGSSIAALAHVNPYLRTVVVDDTLIADEVLDEIDVACQYNQSNFESNQFRVDEQSMKEADLSRLKQRLQRIIRAHSKRTHYCVAHLFGCCPNGDMCLLSHALNNSDAASGDANLSQKISDLFASGGNWEERLPSRPKEGASWRCPDEGQPDGPRLNLRRRREQQKLAAKSKERSALGIMSAHWRWPVALACVVATMTVVVKLARR